MSRSEFLRGEWGDKRPEFKPPWALTEPEFSNACDGCGECVPACEENIIFMTSGNFPQIDFELGGCTFCGKCSAVCKTGALQHTADSSRAPWQLEAGIGPDCLLKGRTQCSRCVESCEEDAIIVKQVIGGQWDIRVETSACTGCGMCIATCPVAAISLQHCPESAELDNANRHQAENTITDIQNQADVLSASLIYQYNDQIEPPLEAPL